MNNQTGYQEGIDLQWSTAHGGATLPGACRSTGKALPCPDCGAVVYPLYGTGKEYGYKRVCKACYANYPDEWTAMRLQEARDVMAELKEKENVDA